MKFIIKKNAVQDVLSKIQGITSRKTNMLITTHVLLRTTSSGIAFYATDHETGYQGFFKATVEKEGSVALNSKKLYEIVRDFPTEDIIVHEIENHWIRISNKNVEYFIVGMNPEEFPEMPNFEQIDTAEIEADKLRKMIDRTMIVSGLPDDKRAHNIGVFCELTEKESRYLFRMVSTDGGRLSVADYAYKNKPLIKLDKAIIIPKKGLYELNKFLDLDGKVKIGVKGNNSFVLKKADETITIRLLEGSFPDYKNILDKKADKPVQMDKNLFLMMLKRMSILSSDNYKGVLFNFTKENLIINSTNPEIGESKEDMKLTFEGDPFEAAFNPRFFMDTLNVIDNESVLMSIINEENPCFLEDPEDKSFISVIMPMRM